MAINKFKIEGGQGGKRGHSNMEHSVYSEEHKEASRKNRRLEAKRVVREELAARDGEPPRPRKPRI